MEGYSFLSITGKCDCATLTTLTANASLPDGARSWRVKCTDDGPNTGQSTAWTLNIDTTPPVTTDDYDGLWHTSDITITLTATDTDGSGVDETYYKINNGPTRTVSANGQPVITTEGTNNTLEYWSMDMVTNEELPHNMLTDIKLDKTAPDITPQYPETVPDYTKFNISAQITDANLKNVSFWQGTEQINYTVDGDTYTSECLGPFPEGMVLNYTIAAQDMADNTANEDFNISVEKGKVKIEGNGKQDEGNRTIKIELEAKWKNSKAKGEFQLKEMIFSDNNGKKKMHKGKNKGKMSYKAHGKISGLYRDCDGTFIISGMAKVWNSTGMKMKKKEEVPFTGEVTKDGIKIKIAGKEYAVPAKVKIKEGVSGGGHHHRGGRMG